MHKIFKYTLAVAEKQELILPVGSRIIRVEEVDGQLFLWAIVNPEPECPKEIRFLECYKTGQAIITALESLEYVGLGKLFIAQELGLYFFENTEKRKII